MKVYRYILLLLSTVVFTACGDTMQFFETQMEKMGYIRFKTPLQEAGTGTLIGGTPQELALVAGPQTCFPDRVWEQQEEVETNLRYLDHTVVPRRTERFSVDQTSFVRLFEVLGSGNPSIKAGLGLNYAQGIELEMTGVHVEYLDSIHLSEYYKSPYMNETCREYLDAVAFIIQALKVEKMKFTFFDKTGGRIELTVDNIQNFLDIGTDVRWQIERQTSLIIDTPKYIGFQLGALRRKDQDMIIYRASGVKDGKFDFKSIYVFEDLDRQEDSQDALDALWGNSLDNQESYFMTLDEILEMQKDIKLPQDMGAE